MTTRPDPHDLLVQLACKALNAMPGVVAWQNLSPGDVKIVGWKPGMFKKVSPGAERGVADILCVAHGLYAEFEAKTTARKATSALSADQRRHRDKVLAAGGLYSAFADPTEPAAILRAWLHGKDG